MTQHLSKWLFPFPSYGKHNKDSCPLFSLPPLASWLSPVLLHVALPGMACWVISCLFNGSWLLIFWPPRLCMLSHFSHVQLFVILWTIVHQAPLSMGFSRQEYWSGLPFPSPGDIPEPGIEPGSLTSPALAGGFFVASAPGKTPYTWIIIKPTFWNTICPHLTLDWCGQGNPEHRAQGWAP